MRKNNNYSLLNTLKKVKSKRNNNLAMFNSAHDEVIGALNLGYSAKDIWQGLRQDRKFLGSYATFLRLMNEVLGEQTKQILVSVEQNINGNEQDLEQIRQLTAQLKDLLAKTQQASTKNIPIENLALQETKTMEQVKPSEPQQLTAPPNAKPLNYREKQQKILEQQTAQLKEQEKLKRIRNGDPPLDGSAFKIQKFNKDELI